MDAKYGMLFQWIYKIPKTYVFKKSLKAFLIDKNCYSLDEFFF